MELLNKNILVTGATGVVGKEIIRAIFQTKGKAKIFAAARNIDKAKVTFEHFPKLQYRYFDLEKFTTFGEALLHIDTLFLIRPPHMSDVGRYFQPLMESVQASGIKEIVFLSVQGAEKSSIIPHHRIETLIRTSGISYTFLRPSYFMQNLTSTLLEDIKHLDQIFVPAGRGIFNWVDVKDIGAVGAKVLCDFTAYANQAIELTGNQNLTFQEAARIISASIGKTVLYENPNVFAFFKRQKARGMEYSKIMIMTLLHALARFQKEPKIMNNILSITGNEPTSLAQFCEREKELFLN